MAGDKKIDLRYREMSRETLCILRDSHLFTIKNIEASGQSDSINGRAQTRAEMDKVTDELLSIEAALKFLGNPQNDGFTGAASRLASFNRGCHWEEPDN